ncbi:disease resistance protein At4g27190-like isoform X3 [Macadamia integrifolia]|uniref:disease resistance protein At4g27190-like isoform X3 n=1 Tax=Macadamia integrifolia TaxID=60698 RepID=UPI001C4E501A|nr:disease resistance protein At4g27190-like isoform X3 [Macadamia integrifolia]
MGGVGKTTLMNEIVKELKNKGFFDEVLMVTVSQDLILKKIHDDIAENLGFKLEEANESVRARRLLVRIAQEKRILIILDDLWDPLTLTEVGIPYEDREDIGNDVRGFKCCVIIATRFIEVCDQMNTQYNVEVKVLPEADAWQLFRTSAGDCVDSTVFHEVAREVVKECGGLPVALVTIGKALRNKDQIVWLDAVTQLKKSIPSRIPDIFEDIENMKEAKNRLHTVLDTLKRSCFLLNVDEKEGCVRMHDIVRDVAISIASLEEHGFVVKAGIGLKEWPKMEILRKCKRLSLMQNKISKLPEQMCCSQL